MSDNHQAQPRVFEDPEDSQWYYTDSEGSVIGPYDRKIAADWALRRDDDIAAGKRPRATPDQEVIIQQFNTVDNAVKEMEEQISALKAQRKYIGEHEMVEIIPVVDRDRGLRLSDGTEWTFSEELHASVKNENKQAAYTYITEQGDSGMLRKSFTFSFKANAAQEVSQFSDLVRRLLPEYEVSIRSGRVPDILPTAIKALLKQAGLDPVVTMDQEVTLPGATMKSWVTKRLAQGKEVPECFSYFAPLRPKMVAPAIQDDVDENVLSQADVKPA